MPIPRVVSGAGTPQADGQGTFVVGSLAYFFLDFFDAIGEPFDPSDINIEILDSAGETVEEIENADKVDVGTFVVNWDIPADTTPGKYTLSVEYVAETPSGPETNTYTEDFVVIESGSYIDHRQIAFRAYLESLIGYTQKCPVFHEPARLDKTRTLAALTFPRWNQVAGAKVFINGQPRETGFSVDYLKGQVLFDSALSVYDQVSVSYNFRWLTDEELDGFIANGFNIFNNWPPHTVYNITNLPERFAVAVFYGAAIDAIRRWMMDVQFQEPAKIFGGLDMATKIFGQMDTLKKNYEEWLEKILEQKKYGPYVGLTKTITVPEYTLPGGRSRWFRYLFKGA